MRRGVFSTTSTGRRTRRGAFHFIECWESQADLDAHREEPHYKNFREKLPDLLAEPVGVKFLEALDSTMGVMSGAGEKRFEEFYIHSPLEGESMKPSGLCEG